jgi:hypothetical protein
VPTVGPENRTGSALLNHIPSSLPPPRWGGFVKRLFIPRVALRPPAAGFAPPVATRPRPFGARSDNCTGTPHSGQIPLTLPVRSYPQSRHKQTSSLRSRLNATRTSIQPRPAPRQIRNATRGTMLGTNTMTCSGFVARQRRPENADTPARPIAGHPFLRPARTTPPTPITRQSQYSTRISIAYRKSLPALIDLRSRYTSHAQTRNRPARKSGKHHAPRSTANRNRPLDLGMFTPSCFTNRRTRLLRLRRDRLLLPWNERTTKRTSLSCFFEGPTRASAPLCATAGPAGVR